MKKEELLALGLTEEQAKGVFALNGKVIEHEQAKAKAELEKVTAERDGLKNDLASVQKDLKSYSKQAADNEELAAKLRETEEALETASKEREAVEQKFKFDAALSAKAAELKLRNPADLSRFLELDKVTLKDDGTFEGLDEQVKNLQTNNSYLFEGEITPGYNPAGGKTPEVTVNSLGDAVKDFYK